MGQDMFNYFQKFGNFEPWRTPEDDPNNRPLQLGSAREVTQRLVDQNWILCGTPDHVKRLLDAERTVHGGGELEYFSWNFYAQGSLPLDEQRRQLELFGTKVMPEFL
jgi:hypothetical protein